MIKCEDSFKFLSSLEKYSNDIIYCDPPYQLGSEIIIRKDGKVDYKKSVDFMGKWEGLSGDYWSAWFVEAFRTLKHGGYLIMFGMDRQLLLFKYYACLAGFVEQQSLYWYFISNFPKATDLSKMIDKNLGVDVKEYGGIVVAGQTGGKHLRSGNEMFFEKHELQTDLAKKYEGYKYSISPLKQTNETIMVFQKPCLTGSPLHDTLAYEKGDKTISVSALNIDGNRVGTEKRDQFSGKGTNGDVYLEYPQENAHWETVEGRYPAQTFIDSQVAEILDLQSGVSGGGKYVESGFRIGGDSENSVGISGEKNAPDNYGDIGGCSKILHKCDYTTEDYDLYNYEPKVSSSERNAGCDGFDEVQSANLPMRSADVESVGLGTDGSATFRETKTRNNHPTLKPISLNEKILKLFKTPNDQRICYAFAGAGSEIIGGIKAGFDNWCGCEISQEYVDIANARIKYWKEEMSTQTSIFDFL